MRGPANLVRRHSNDAAVCPHALRVCKLGTRLAALVKIEVALIREGVMGRRRSGEREWGANLAPGWQLWKG